MGSYFPSPSFEEGYLCELLHSAYHTHSSLDGVLVRPDLYYFYLYIYCTAKTGRRGKSIPNRLHFPPNFPIISMKVGGCSLVKCFRISSPLIELIIKFHHTIYERSWCRPCFLTVINITESCCCSSVTFIPITSCGSANTMNE